MIDDVDEILARYKLQEQSLKGLLESISSLMNDASCRMHKGQPDENDQAWELMSGAHIMLNAASGVLDGEPPCSFDDAKKPQVEYVDRAPAVDAEVAL